MGIVTLLSDFGYQDAYVASTRGIIAGVFPTANVIDLAHNAEPFNLQQAAYLLSSAYRNFPEGTCHIILYDIFYRPQPELLLCSKSGQYFMAPDNGILPLALGRDIDACYQCHALTDNETMKDWLIAATKTALALQTTPITGLGLPNCELKNAPNNLQPRIEGSMLEGYIIHIDRYGNVVTNITQEMFQKTGRNRSFHIGLVRDEMITEISKRYTDVKDGEKLCRFNAAGYLEIAINRGNAARLLGLRQQKEQHLIYNTIKITFE